MSGEKQVDPTGNTEISRVFEFSFSASEDEYKDPLSNSMTSFPYILFALLEREETGILEWASNGSCFRIVDETRLTQEIIPKLFKRK
jgi:hypothetical protein